MQGGKQVNTYGSDEKLIAILFAIKEKDIHTVTTLAEELGIAKSTVHAHLMSLQQDGFVHKDDNKYYVGLRFLDFGSHARNRHELYQISKEKVNELAERTGERVWCVVEEEGTAVYLYEATGPNAIHTDETIGQRRPLHNIAAGKAIFAFLPEERRERLLETIELEKSGPNTIIDREELKRELEKVRERGVAYNFEEVFEGVNAVACPIRKADEGVYGAISIGGPAKRLTEERMKDEYLEVLQGITNEIEVNIRYQ